MNYNEIAEKIIHEVGGAKNIDNVYNCMTRLRFELKKESLANDEKIKSISGVTGIVRQGGQYQLIIGKEVVNFFNAIQKIIGPVSEHSSGVKKEQKGNIVKRVITGAIEIIASSMTPVIPALIGAGIIQMIVIIMSFFLGQDNSTLRFLSIISHSAFYFMPIFIAYAIARRFNANPVLAAVVTAVLLNPQFIEVMNEAKTTDVTFLGIPVMSAQYASTIIPAILIAWIVACTGKIVDRFTPSMTKTFLNPALIILISAPIAFTIIGPVGTFLATSLASGVELMQSHLNLLTMVLLAAFMPFIVMTGLHWAFTPIVLGSLASGQGDGLILPIMLVINMAQGAASIAVGIKSRNSKLKQTSLAAGFTCIFSGLTEPCMYGVNLPLKKPMIAACIASGITGLFICLVKLKSFAFGISSLVALPMFINPENHSNIIFACSAALMVIFLTMALTFILGFDDPADEKNIEPSDLKGKNNENSQSIVSTFKTIDGQILNSPVTGKIVPLSKVNDLTFSTEALGKGVGIIADEGRVYAPFNGTVLSIFPTKHAIGLASETGIELLIHIGIDTVKLNGNGFTSFVNNGDTVKEGDLLIEFDIEMIQSLGYDITTIVVIANSENYQKVDTYSEQIAHVRQPLLSLA
ncbi:PTS system protein [Klebsiella pneumoniae]|uniref:beta-glucoside-specific PTS transporter subunit IIABC n=1 Tax=Klebsiella TaxID=570 RepID=UPI0009BB6605|nr:beta-glucoside-specific PTS transporter subunit IIABC [Klebsiella pneumoniae]SLX80480.1 PTS system protein [Klebsiella pneumoniae]SLY00174.1 PTS system protein [Klebsiella pneumoniae]SLY24028.1 PTS system protein [Klebsiella pneumoniae]SLY24351.1 PTS system protein [Klebsiella pneumoniae]SMB56268.1 PTS system protein [Klebsiella pneumoniae]